MTPSRRSASWAPSAATESASGAAGGAVSGAVTEWGAALRGLHTLLLPDRCGACGRATAGLLCDACLASCRAPRGPACARCGADWSPRGCGRCARFGRAFAFDRAVALWRYGGAAQRLVRNAKLGGRLGLLAPAGRAMAACARLRPGASSARLVEPGSRGVRRAAFARGWIVVPIPARRGGTPHAERLAAGYAAAARLPLRTALRRRRAITGTQARERGAARRRRLGAAFAARPSLVAERRVLLLDDVLSTGGTADAAARALRLAGAHEVVLLSLAS